MNGTPPRAATTCFSRTQRAGPKQCKSQNTFSRVIPFTGSRSDPQLVFVANHIRPITTPLCLATTHCESCDGLMKKASLVVRHKATLPIVNTARLPQLIVSSDSQTKKLTIKDTMHILQFYISGVLDAEEILLQTARIDSILEIETYTLDSSAVWNTWQILTIH